MSCPAEAFRNIHTTLWRDPWQTIRFGTMSNLYRRHRFKRGVLAIGQIQVSDASDCLLQGEGVKDAEV